DSRDVDEHVLLAGRWTDEPVALSRIEPFDGALLHRLSPSQSERLVNARKHSLQFARQTRLLEEVRSRAPAWKNDMDAQRAGMAKIRFVYATDTRNTAEPWLVRALWRSTTR